MTLFLSVLCMLRFLYLSFFFNYTATREIYTLSLHDALPILSAAMLNGDLISEESCRAGAGMSYQGLRSEEHTSELQSRQYLVCRLLLEKKKQTRSAPERRSRNKQETIDRNAGLSASAPRKTP